MKTYQITVKTECRKINKGLLKWALQKSVYDEVQEKINPQVIIVKDNNEIKDTIRWMIENVSTTMLDAGDTEMIYERYLNRNKNERQ